MSTTNEDFDHSFVEALASLQPKPKTLDEQAQEKFVQEKLEHHDTTTPASE